MILDSGLLFGPSCMYAVNLKTYLGYHRMSVNFCIETAKPIELLLFEL